VDQRVLLHEADHLLLHARRLGPARCTVIQVSNLSHLVLNRRDAERNKENRQ
jgi:hypothetical protein